MQRLARTGVRAVFMRFAIEQNFLTDSSGRPIGQTPVVAYHVVDAETLETALGWFLDDQQASLIGTVQRLAGAHAVATAQQARTVFTIHIAAGSDIFLRQHRGETAERTDDDSAPDRTRRP